MKPTNAQKMAPLENPHSKSSKYETKGVKKSSDIDEVLDKIKEKSRLEIAESKKRKVHVKKDKGQAVPGDKPVSAAPGDPEAPKDIVSQIKVEYEITI